MDALMTEIDVERIGPEAARALAPLLAALAQERLGGSPPRPDRYYTERLLAGRGIEFVGARCDGELVGFAQFHEWPDVPSGLDCGLIDGLWVRPDRRRLGIGRRLIDHVAGEGRRRGWSRLRWLVDETSASPPLPAIPARTVRWRSSAGEPAW